MRSLVVFCFILFFSTSVFAAERRSLEVEAIGNEMTDLLPSSTYYRYYFKSLEFIKHDSPSKTRYRLKYVRIRKSNNERVNCTETLEVIDKVKVKVTSFLCLG